jgi:hypothetical protein
MGVVLWFANSWTNWNGTLFRQGRGARNRFGQFCVVDQGSKHRTFVNGERVQRKSLERNDRVEFGVRGVSYVVFHPHHASSNTAREFLSQISGIQLSTDSTDLEKLTLFLEAAHTNTTSNSRRWAAANIWSSAGRFAFAADLIGVLVNDFEPALLLRGLISSHGPIGSRRRLSDWSPFPYRS